MLKVELTKNYAGVAIYGDYEDLNYLYDSINYLIRGDTLDIGEYMMQNHLYGFLYDVRHAYQGDRGFKLIDNGLQNFKRDWFEIKKKDVTDNNIYFGFNYLLPDVILDMILIKHFVKKVEKKDNDIYNQYINMVNYFYSQVLYSLQSILTEIRFNKVKNGIMKAFIFDRVFIPQWFELISVDYAKMTKKKREKEFMHIVDAIYNYMEYEDYYEMKKKLESMGKEDNCTLNNFHYEDYPEEIEW